MLDKGKIIALKDGEVWIVPESDYGKAEIWLKHETYFLFEIPAFGGQPSFFKAYRSHIDEMINDYNSWT